MSVFTPASSSRFKLRAMRGYGLRVAVFMVGLGLASLFWVLIRGEQRRAEEVRFERLGERATRSILFHLQDTEEALYGARALFDVNEGLGRDEWVAYMH